MNWAPLVTQTDYAVPPATHSAWCRSGEGKIVGNTRRLGQLGMLAVGLSVGAAVAHSPVASADTSSDPISWLSGLDLASPAPSSASDFQISFNGMDLFPTAGNEATAVTVAGQYGLAIAFGDNSYAYAGGGTGDYALADGTNSFAQAGSYTATTDDYDTAVDIGNNVDPAGYAGTYDGAYAGGGSLFGGAPDDGVNAHDTAIDIGNNGLDGSGFGGDDGAFAGDAGTLFGGAGSGDTAYHFGNVNGYSDGTAASGGDNNYASMSGTINGDLDQTSAVDGNNNVAITDTSYTTSDNPDEAISGDNDYSYVFGPDNSYAQTGDGDNDIAYVWDPFGTGNAPDSAIAGFGSSNLAEVLLTHGDASAQGGSMLYDIISLFGTFTS
jgi:hypothetical protein